MEISVDVKLSGQFADVAKMFDFSGHEMWGIGIDARERMQNRINSSKDVNDRRFKRYSENTKATKRELGKNPNRVDMRNSGTMRNSIRVQGKRNVAELNVTLHRRIGIYQQLGTAPYTIKPRNAKTLKFQGVDGTVFAKSVNHPGLPKREWFGLTKKTERNVYLGIKKLLIKKINKEWR